MDFNTYKALAIRTESVPDHVNVPAHAIHAVLTADAYVAELADVLKRAIFYGKEFDLARYREAAEQLAQASAFISYFASATATNNAGAFVEGAQDEYMRNFSLNQMPVRVLHGILGIISEGGEISSIGCQAIGGTPIDAVHVGEELGDVRWYDSVIVDALALNSNSISEANIAKLKKRYPEKFSADAATNRNLDGERQALEAGVAAAG